MKSKLISVRYHHTEFCINDVIFLMTIFQSKKKYATCVLVPAYPAGYGDDRAFSNGPQELDSAISAFHGYAAFSAAVS